MENVIDTLLPSQTHILVKEKIRTQVLNSHNFNDPQHTTIHDMRQVASLLRHMHVNPSRKSLTYGVKLTPYCPCAFQHDSEGT